MHDSDLGGCAHLSAHDSGSEPFALALDCKFNVGRRLSLLGQVSVSPSVASCFSQHLSTALASAELAEAFHRPPTLNQGTLICFCPNHYFRARDLQSLAIITVTALKGSRKS